MTDRATRRDPGVVAAAAVAIALLGAAVSVDFPRAAHGFKGDEATYYMLGHSLARDFDFAYERRDLVRVWDEYHAPEGVFLKRGKVNRFERTPALPFVRRTKADDPDQTRLYFGKSFIYPLFAAPFIRLFGTSGFLVFHALLLALDVLVAYVWLVTRGSTRFAAAGFALVFFGASVAPVYFVWLTPELFNLSLVLYAAFLWSYKEVARDVPLEEDSFFLRGAGSDYLAAALAGILAFSKPPIGLVALPMLLLAAWRRQWRRAVVMGALFALVAGGLFLWNCAISGEFNYQGGYRKTFYSQTGFPFANTWETFDNVAPIHGRSDVLIDTLANQHSFDVFRHNAWYFLVGRHSGLVPYFFPGAVSAVLFLTARRARQRWQWLALATIAAAAAAQMLLTPYSWSGGGGPVGNRYFLSFYPLLLLLAPPLSGVRAPLVALAVGALFVAKILINPFWSSFNPGEHVKSGPLRLLPLELTMLNDLPVNAKTDRSRRIIGGGIMSYFPDDNAYTPEGDSFWVRGKSRADVILRAPLAELPGGGWRGREIARLAVEIHNGPKPNTVTIDSGRERQTIALGPNANETVMLKMPEGVPYRPYETPTSYVYAIRVTSADGFVPFLEAPPSSDSRLLGALITLRPEFR
jgi:hypothetical protein